MADFKQIDEARKLLTLFCYVCPLCIFARRFPESKFAHEVEKIRKSCPFCRAYARLKSEK